MNPPLSRKQLIVIVGPTAVGKTSVAISLATHFKTEIISADSRQFYGEMSIGTAVPSSHEKKKVPHHFIQHLTIDDYYNVSRYEVEALKLLEKLFNKYSMVIAAGGSGMYLQTLCHGIDEIPDPDIELRKEIKDAYANNGLEYLREQLKILDPEYWQIADLSNPNRMMRAIEVCKQTGSTYSSLRKQKSKARNFNIIKLGLQLPRQELYERINHRVDTMMQEGLIEEAKKLYPHKEFNALQTVGYKELFNFFEGKISLEAAIEKIKTNTRRYAKRQITWFKRDDQIKWFHPDETWEMIRYIEERMGKEI